jgi:nucleotide-binding universal stress UspA family protein
MKKILCPTDHSDTAQNAIGFAAKMAQKMGAELILFNVQSLIELTTVEFIRGSALRIEAEKELLNAQSMEISKTFKISCYAIVQRSDVSLAETIDYHAKGYDLIIMGTDGPHNLIEFFSGSKTYKAARRTDVPVLLVPSGCMYRDITTVTYAYDYLREKTLPMQQLIPFMKAMKASLTVLEILEEAKSDDMLEELNELQGILKNEYGSEVTLGFETLRSSEVPQAIHTYITTHQPDALAVCSIHRNFLSALFHTSIFKTLSITSEVPILAFHK